ncbi:MAG: hypothetical protein AB1813_03400 [Verrucomicrobiota bacterium]|jgi:hypothetical protein
MITLDALIGLPGKCSALGEFKASRQFIISTHLLFADIKAHFDSVLAGAEFEYLESRQGYRQPSGSYFVSGPSSNYEHRWQIEILRSDDRAAIEDIFSYLCLDESDTYIEPGSKHFVVVFDNHIEG